MARHHPDFDEAVSYVLAELGPEERRAFEHKLAASRELRALVTELEAGATALAFTPPQYDPPPRVWQRIQSIAAAEQPQSALAAWPFAWLRSGWGAAAVCVAGWALTVLWITGGRPVLSPTQPASEPAAMADRTVDHAPGAERDPGPPQQTGTNPIPTLAPLSLQAKGQISALRSELLDLESRVVQLSQVVTQQQALLMDPARLKFFNLAPAGAEAGTNSAPPTAAAQRALLLAVARRLGWSSAMDDISEPSPPPATNPPPPSQVRKDENSNVRESGQDHAPPGVASAIPGYATVGTNGAYDVTLAMDSAMLPAGVSTLDVWITPFGAATSSMQFYGPWEVGPGGSVLTVENVSSIAISAPPLLQGGTNYTPVSWILTNAP